MQHFSQHDPGGCRVDQQHRSLDISDRVGNGERLGRVDGDIVLPGAPHADRYNTLTDLQRADVIADGLDHTHPLEARCGG